MRKIQIIRILVLCGLMMPGLIASADEKKKPGRLHSIDITAAHPKAYHPNAGDLVQCYFKFPVVPGRIAGDLQVNIIDGNSIKLLGVFHTQPPRLLGADELSAYFTVPRNGLSHVEITPVIAGQPAPTKPFRLAFLVGEEDDEKTGDKEGDEDQDTSSASEPKTAAPPAKHSGHSFKAWVEKRGDKHVLRVEGVMSGPNPGAYVDAEPAVPQGINPKILILDVTQKQLPGIWTQVITDIPGCYHQNVQPDQYDQVTIRVEGGHEFTLDVIKPEDD